ncbi:12761_t:CDS:2, partial [Rhizophagus irregularis]
MDRLSDDKSLNIKKTFESQRKKVNNIIPVVQKSINKKFFLVTDGVIKHVIHECHRHQWEELLNARRGANWVENDKKGGTQILDKKREKRSKIIDKLITLKDRLTKNRYHSPEKSETDEDNLTN